MSVFGTKRTLSRVCRNVCFSGKNGHRLITNLITLQDLKDKGKLVWVYCNECCLEREVEQEAFGQPLSTPVKHIGPRIVYKQCGCRRTTTRPQLYDMTVPGIAAHEKVPPSG